MRILFGLLFCLAVFCSYAEESFEENIILSTPEQIATLSYDREMLIGGLVSPISGQVALRKTDLFVKAAQNIATYRIYIPPIIPGSFPRHKTRQEEWNNYYLSQHLRSNYKGWAVLPHLRVDFFHGRRQVRVTNPNGLTLDYNTSTGRPITNAYALNNVMGDIPSGKCDPRNTRVEYITKADTLIVHDPDGTKRYYSNCHFNNFSHYIYYLIKEILPSGKILLYHYDGGQLHTIEATDPKERFTYATVRIKQMRLGFCSLQASNGLTAHYNRH